ncbi:MAG: nickel-dependent hydrogenase large subunit [Nitrososphaerales archaeon]
MTTITIDPVTRIEGHLKIELETEDDTVKSAKNTATLFRGFENIVVGRDPRDCATILSAICGVCHSDHHIVSVRAVENAAGVTEYTDNYANEKTDLPLNAILSRNIIQGANTLYSHAAHILVLTGPDYRLFGLLDALSQSVVVNNYADLLKWVIIPAQQLMHQIITLLGGKTPHQRGSIPGGNPVKPDIAVIGQILERVSELRKITDLAVPPIWNFVTERALILAGLGTGTGNYVSMGMQPDPTTGNGTSKVPYIFKRGAILDSSPSKLGAIEPFDPDNLTENVEKSWYDQPGTLKVFEEEPPKPDMSISGAYSWAKSPLYKGKACEVGPLSRVLVSGIYQTLGEAIHSIIPDVPGLPLNPMGSVFDRTVARALELVALVGSDNTTKNLEVLGEPLNLSLVDVLTALGLRTAEYNGLMDKWIKSLEPGKPSYMRLDVPGDREGIGLWEAPRGSLFHWIRIKGGKTDNYQVIAPTTWNVHPDGPLEKALVGTPIDQGVEDPALGDMYLRKIAWVVRSFDLCLACTVHAIHADGSKSILEFP